MYRTPSPEALKVEMPEIDLCEWCAHQEPWRMNECGLGNPCWDERWPMTECPSYKPREGSS